MMTIIVFASWIDGTIVREMFYAASFQWANLLIIPYLIRSQNMRIIN